MRGASREIEEKAAILVHNELLWADTTTDLTNRYLTFQFGTKKRSMAYIESKLKLLPMSNSG